MNFLGIGPLELVFIVILLLIIFGPKDLQKAGKTIGQTLRRIKNSETWRAVIQTSQSIRDLPKELIHQAEIDEITKTLKQTEQSIKSTDFNTRENETITNPTEPIK